MNLWGASAVPLGWADAFFALLLAGVLAALVRKVGPADEDAASVFLGGRAVPWWAAALALLSAEISALTIVSLAAAAFSSSWSYGQFFAGSLAARAACWALLPRLREGHPATAYGWVALKAGPLAGKLCAGLFCAGRGAAAALRLVVAAAALTVLTGLGPAWWALLLAAAAAVIVGYGGFRAVVWTGAWSAAVIVITIGIVLVYVLLQTPGNVFGVWRLADAGGRLALFDADALPSALMGGFAGTLAGFAADHELVQRLLSCSSDREARAALAAATAGSALTLLMLLSLGTCLYAFYGAHPALAVPARLDTIAAHFAATVLPGPLRGLVFFALILSAVDLPLSSLSAVSWHDLGPAADRLPERARWRLAGGWAAALAVAALAIMGWEDLSRALELAWPVAAGPILGLVLVAARRRPSEGQVAAASAIAGLIVASLLAWLTSAGFEAAWIAPVSAAIVLLADAGARRTRAAR